MIPYLKDFIRILDIAIEWMLGSLGPLVFLRWLLRGHGILGYTGGCLLDSCVRSSHRTL
jgi:hypothetical protein